MDWEKEFDKEFDQYNPINDTGVGMPVWSGTDYKSIKDFIRSQIEIAYEKGQIFSEK